MGLGIGRAFKKIHRKMSVLDKIGIGVNDKGGTSLGMFLDPAGVFTGESDAFHKKLGIGVKPPQITGMGTDPEPERVAAETAAAQQAAQKIAERKRMLRKNSLAAGGKSKGSPSLSSVLAYGKTQLGE